MWWQWLIFALLIIIIPFSLGYFAVYIKRKNKPTKEQEKAMNLNVVKYTLFYWLGDLFYMSFIIDSIACKYIFGGLIMLIIFYNLSNAFIRKKGANGNIFIKWGMLQDFLVGIGLSIYLIYIIPNNDLREIVSVIIAAIYGGLLTLVGVAWTIQHSDQQKREDELTKAKPLFTFNVFAKIEATVHNQKVCLVDSNVNPKNIFEASYVPKGIESFMEIENSSQSSFTVKRFYFDAEWHWATANNVVLPNNQLLIQLYRQDLITHPIMEIEDIFGRKYYYDLMFIPLLPNRTTLNEIKEIAKQEVLARKINLD